MTRLYDSTRGASGHHPLNEWNYGSPRARALADKVLSGPGVGSMEALLGQVQRGVGDLDVQATPPVSGSGLPPRTPEEGAGRPPPDVADRYGEASAHKEAAAKRVDFSKMLSGPLGQVTDEKMADRTGWNVMISGIKPPTAARIQTRARGPAAGGPSAAGAGGPAAAQAMQHYVPDRVLRFLGRFVLHRHEGFQLYAEKVLDDADLKDTLLLFTPGPFTGKKPQLVQRLKEVLEALPAREQAVIAAVSSPSPPSGSQESDG